MSKYKDLKGIFFDYGGVIETIHFDESLFQKGAVIIGNLLQEVGIRLGIEALIHALRTGQNAYESWCWENSHRELPNADIWTTFFLKKQCQRSDVKERVTELSEKLSSIYEFYLYKRRPPNDMVEVLRTLFRNRFTLAIISNTMSMTLIPERLKKFDIDKYLNTVVLSMNTGFRKPRGEIFQSALNQTGLGPERCIFVGDTLSRDIVGSKDAGFLESILIPSGVTEEKDRKYSGTIIPDHTIDSLSELITLLR